MYSMKKILLLILSLLMIFSFVACSSNNDKNNEETKQPTQSTEQTTPDDETKVPDIEDVEEVDIVVEFSDVIPDGGTYYHNNAKWEDCRKIFEFTLGEKLTTGQTMPEHIMDGDIFIYKNMIYVYNAAFTDEGSYGLKTAELNGWSVYCASAENLEEVLLLNVINNKPVVRASYIFQHEAVTPNLKKIIVSNNIRDVSYLLEDCELQGDLSIMFMGTPEKYKSCLNIHVLPTFNEDKITFESTHTITIFGNCDETIKNAIAGETEVAMNIEIK